MFVEYKDINSLARSKGPGSIAVRTSVSLPPFLFGNQQHRFPSLPTEIPAYSTGNGLSVGGNYGPILIGALIVGAFGWFQPEIQKALPPGMRIAAPFIAAGAGLLVLRMLYPNERLFG